MQYAVPQHAVPKHAEPRYIALLLWATVFLCMGAPAVALNAPVMGYPKMILEHAKEANANVHVLFVLQPEMITRLSADQRQLHIQLTPEAYGAFMDLVVDNYGAMVTVQAPTGEEVVTQRIDKPLESTLILSKPFKKRTDLQRLYKALVRRR